MNKLIRTCALALALAATPACASLPFGRPAIENPITGQALDQRAYALLGTYAAVVEEAADIVRDPAVPISVKRAIGRAERAATPAAEALGVATRAYLHARDAGAAARLDETVAAAQAPIRQFEALIRAQGGE